MDVIGADSRLNLFLLHFAKLLHACNVTVAKTAPLDFIPMLMLLSEAEC